MFVELFLFVFIASLLAAAPFGLVNLTVMHISYFGQRHESYKLTAGAVIVEIVFAFTAYLSGKGIVIFLEGHAMLKSMMLFIPLVISLIFFFKKSKITEQLNIEKYGFLAGALLNLMSIQVFFFWLMAFTYQGLFISTDKNVFQFLVVVFAVLAGKTAMLLIYIKYSHYFMSKQNILSSNFNRIIGVVIFISVIFSYFR